MDDLHYRHPLNLAHKYGRSAELFENVINIQEALNCHQKAIEYLEQAISVTTFDNILQSLRLQRDFHINRKQILRLKSLHFRLHQNLIEQQKRQMALEQSQACICEKPDNNLKWTIFRHIETVDSLLNVLIDEKKHDAETAELHLPVTAGYTTSGQVIGTKHPKSDTVVIEELHTLNVQLRNLVSQLLAELNNAQRDVKTLHEKLNYYESFYPKDELLLNDKCILELNSLPSSSSSSSSCDSTSIM